MKVITIGVSGVTCGGKSTLAAELKTLFPDGQAFCQDDYFYDEDDPRHTWCKDVNHLNYDIIESIDMEKMHQDLIQAIGTRKLCTKPSIKHNTPDEMTQNEILDSIKKIMKEQQIKLIILDGFLLFNYQPFCNLITQKYFFTLTREECENRRNRRVYQPPDVPGYFEKCVWPMYLKHLDEVKRRVSDVVYFDDETKNVLDVVLQDMYDILSRSSRKLLIIGDKSM